VDETHHLLLLSGRLKMSVTAFSNVILAKSHLAITGCLEPIMLLVMLMLDKFHVH
jgi:hypothetical protein